MAVQLFQEMGSVGLTFLLCLQDLFEDAYLDRQLTNAGCFSYYWKSSFTGRTLNMPRASLRVLSQAEICRWISSRLR